MHDHFAALVALCAPEGGAATGAALLAGMLLAGLAGSLAHCTFMCGPFVLAQVGARLERVPAASLCERARIGNALLLPYHAGRIATYAGLGAVAATTGAVLRAVVQPASSFLLLGAAVLFAAQAGLRLAPRLHRRHLTPQRHGAFAWPGPVRRVLARLDVTTTLGSLALGLALGFLPCAMLYAAVAAASAASSPLGGALMLAAFGLGTVPALVMVGVAGHGAARLWHGAVLRAAPFVMLANAVLLGAMAVRGLAG